MERETGIEPATNSLEGCDSTTELLPPSRSLTRLPSSARSFALRRLPEGLTAFLIGARRSSYPITELQSRLQMPTWVATTAARREAPLAAKTTGAARLLIRRANLHSARRKGRLVGRGGFEPP
jgi:hypothetical protein